MGDDSVSGQYSLLSILIVQGTGDSQGSEGSINFLLIGLIVIIVAILLMIIMSKVSQPEYLPSYQLQKSKENLSGDEILEAELLDVIDDFEKNK